MSEHELAYMSFENMMTSCYDSTSKNYEFIGGAGIRVCERWGASFDNFLADMGDRPPGFMMRRKDAKQDYTPDNCYWANCREVMATQGRLKMTDDLVRELLRLVHEEKRSIPSICERFPVKIAQLTKLAYGKGYRLPGYNYPDTLEGNDMPRIKLTDEMKEGIAKAFNSGAPSMVLARRYNITQRYVRELAKDFKPVEKEVYQVFPKGSSVNQIREGFESIENRIKVAYAQEPEKLKSQLESIAEYKALPDEAVSKNNFKRLTLMLNALEKRESEQKEIATFLIG